MRITVYKGFGSDFLESINDRPLINLPLQEKKNVLHYNRLFRKQLDIALLSLNDSDNVWITYEEYSLIKQRIDDAISEDGLELIILRNNLFPDYYPIEFSIDEDVVNEIINTINGSKQFV